MVPAGSTIIVIMNYHVYIILINKYVIDISYLKKKKKKHCNLSRRDCRSSTTHQFFKKKHVLIHYNMNMFVGI